MSLLESLTCKIGDYVVDSKAVPSISKKYSGIREE